jgi:TatD DNase family protein
MRFFDAHNHLQDDRFQPRTETVLAEARAAGLVRMVVNGSCEADWPAVLDLARRHPDILPSFGYHPWYVRERTPHWRECLAEHLEAIPSAVGEIGLDRWIKDHDLADQTGVLLWQWQWAVAHNRPVSLHCLQAWGALHDLLRTHPAPECGFLLHSYGGPPEMVEPLARLGAYFSLPGYFAHERKLKQRETFRCVPLDRLLVETDAPDQTLPPERELFHLHDAAANRPLNHPGNCGRVYEFAAEWLGVPLPELTDQVEANFQRLFGSVTGK